MPNAPFLAPERDSAYKRARTKAGATQFYTIPGVTEGTQGAWQPSANTDYYAPMFSETPIIIDQLASEVTVTAGTNFRIGIYAADTDWQPVGAPLADSGNLSSAGTGVKTYTPATPVLLVRGRYVSVLNADNTPTLRRLATPCVGGMTMSTSIGSTPLALSWSVGRAYAAFPTPGTPWTTVGDLASGGGHFSAVFFRISSP